MEELIAQYLFQFRNCPLPGIGSLQLKESNAVAWHGDNKLSAPVPIVELTTTQIPVAHFVDFIGSQWNIDEEEAILLLEQYCRDLKSLSTHKEMKLDPAGRFHIDQYGKLTFKQEPLPKEFLPSVAIPLVLRTNPASHNIRVGDNEKTSEQMTEFYSDKETTRKEKWWIAALILAALAAALLFFYFREHRLSDSFGNGKIVTPQTTQSTYRKG